MFQTQTQTKTLEVIDVNSKELQELRARNEARLAVVKEKMGTKYLLHPSNMRTRLTVPR